MKSNLDFTSDISLEKVLEFIKYAESISLTYVAEQFINPSLVEDQKDYNEVKEKSVDLSETRPKYTRNEAFSCLKLRLNDLTFTQSENKNYLFFVQGLNTKKKNNTLSTYESIILAASYSVGIGGKPSDAFDLLNSQLELKNNPYAQYLLGCIYENRSDLLTSLKYYLASKDEVARSCHRIGMLFNHSILYKQDLKEAFKHYKIAAEKKDRLAHFTLAMCYFNGEGCEKDVKNSKEHFIKALLAGDKNSIVIYAKNFLNNEDKNKLLEVALQYGCWSAAYFLINPTISVVKAAYYWRLVMLGPESEVGKKNLDQLRDANMQNNVITDIMYHHAMANNDFNSLLGILLNQTSVFNRLWIADLDSALLKVRNQALKNIVHLDIDDKKIKCLPERLKAHLAIHHFENGNFAKALKYIDGLGTKELTAEENHQIGFLIYSYLIINASHLKEETSALERFGLISEEEKLISMPSFEVSSHHLFIQLETFLKAAGEKDCIEAKRLLQTIQTNKIISQAVNPSRLFRSTSTSAAAHVASLDEDEVDFKNGALF